MLIGCALSAASRRSSAALEFLLILTFFFAIFIPWESMEILIHKRILKANFAENKVLSEEVALERPLPTIRQ